MREWPSVRLGNVLNLKRGFDLPSDQRRVGTVPVVSSGGVSGHHDEAKCDGPGVVIGRYGSVGSVHWIVGPYWPLNTSLFVQDFKGNDRRFIYYLLQTIGYQAHSDKSSVPGVNRNDLHTEKIHLPPLPEQRAIAEVLGALDDKIEVNERMNATLDAMAHALFKSWFVDFEPVRAKAEGRVPSHMDAATAALFPDSFEDSSMGPIPTGWRAGSVDDLVNAVRDGMIPAVIDAGTAYVGLEHIPRGSLALTEWGSAASVTSGKMRFRKQDILFGKLRPYFAKVVVAPMDGVCSSDIVVCRPTRAEYFGLATAQLSDQRFIDYCNAVSNGAKMPRVGVDDMLRYPVPLPDDAVAVSFNERVSPWIALMVANILESRTLAELRDTLLPKLISGELRVRDAAREVEVAV